MDYQFKPVGKTCAASGDPLPPGSGCHSVLLEQEGKLVRQDYAEHAWQGPPENCIGYWRSVVPEESHNKRRIIDADLLLEHFIQLTEEGSAAQEQFRYVLTLLLIQKKRLIISDEKKNGEQNTLVLIGQDGQGPFEVKEQELSDEEIVHLQLEVNKQLLQE